MSTQNYIRLRQLIPVAVKFKQLTISLNINQVNSTAQRILTDVKNLVKFVNFYTFYNGKSRIRSLIYAS